MDARASSTGGCGRLLCLVGLKIVLILVWSGGASAHSDDGKALPLEGAPDSGDKDVYLSHSCIHDEILHQRRRAGHKEYSVMPQVYHVPREKKVERLRGRQLLGLSSWRAPHSNVKKPIRIFYLLRLKEAILIRCHESCSKFSYHVNCPL